MSSNDFASLWELSGNYSKELKVKFWTLPELWLFFSLLSYQPSNSGRAAELLAKEQGTVPGFIGFGTFHSDLGYVPAIQGAEEIDSLVDSDFRMVLRKLSKKDVTTKLKASFVFIKMIKKIFLLRWHWFFFFFPLVKLHNQRSNLWPLYWKRGVLTIEPPGNSHH